MTWMAAVGPLQTASGVTVGEYAACGRERLAPFTSLQPRSFTRSSPHRHRADHLAHPRPPDHEPPGQLVDMTREWPRVVTRAASISSPRRDRRAGGSLPAHAGRVAGEAAVGRVPRRHSGGRTVSVSSPSSAVHTPSKLMPGSVLANRYEIREQLGAGEWASSIARSTGSCKSRSRSRLCNPACSAMPTAGALQAGNPARPQNLPPQRGAHHDLGESDGTYFITMEYVEGTGWMSCSTSGALPLGVILTIGRSSAGRWRSRMPRALFIVTSSRPTWSGCSRLPESDGFRECSPDGGPPAAHQSPPRAASSARRSTWRRSS